MKCRCERHEIPITAEDERSISARGELDGALSALDRDCSTALPSEDARKKRPHRAICARRLI